MNHNFTQISLTYKLRGECLVKAGQYESAKVQVENAFKKNEKCTIVTPLKVISEPLFSYATKRITLGKAFIEQCLVLPPKPKTNAELDLFRNWNKLSIKDKVKYSVTKYVESLGGYDPEFKLM